jgi:hypothetical protein
MGSKIVIAIVLQVYSNHVVVTPFCYSINLSGAGEDMDDQSSSVHRPLLPPSIKQAISFHTPSVLRKRNLLHGEPLPGRQPDGAFFDIASVYSSPSTMSHHFTEDGEEEVSVKEGNIPLGKVEVGNVQFIITVLG